MNSKFSIDEIDSLDKLDSEQHEGDNLVNKDDVLMYACDVLSLGLLYSECY